MNKRQDILYVQVFYIHFYVNIPYKVKTYRHSPQKLIKPLNRLIENGFTYDTVGMSL